ncbi:hypothetical protein CVT26_005950 [Gymnopilus dilepis]|uniref:Uncharacterized protein n=1 Tax=Gymnopilus dilepis TaxID=231916 RepID=A0A409WYY4_9AGAR|nr:hypothetical protein CVT26_005950 [Gymnopilus dilepis]
MVSSKTHSKGSEAGSGAGSGRARGGISGPKLKKSAVIDALSALETSEVGGSVAVKVNAVPANKKKGGDAADKKPPGGNSRKNSSPPTKEDITATEPSALRASRNPHPGLPDAPRPKRSSEVVAAERTDKANKKEQAKQRRNDALAKAAAVEDQMAQADQALASSKGVPPAGLPERHRKARPKPEAVQEEASQESEGISGGSSSGGYQQPEGEESSQSSEAADGSEDEEMLDVSEEEEKPKPKKVKKNKGDVRKAVAENRKVVDKNKKRSSEEKRQ